ncbi:uncharacterized protein LOC128241588 [Mya arenaria]|uniref:uncharacterized protein LOC128241588 n=1 Tax=Mya arenaria TaxID=6604 RepID=UPI0022E85465|nr:uncharacterized protein LOC128241588 [Mya arenaria]
MKLCFYVMLCCYTANAFLTKPDRLSQKSTDFTAKEVDIEATLRQAFSEFIENVHDGLEADKKLQTLEHALSDLGNVTSCACKGYNCGCCVYLSWKAVGLDDTVCVNISYLPAPEYGISVTLTVDGKTYINETVSVRNPPPICIDIPHLKKYASLCVYFNNITVSNKTVQICVAIQARLVRVKVEEIDLGCFRFPVKPEVKVNNKLGQQVVMQGQKVVEDTVAKSLRIKDLNILKQLDVKVKDSYSQQEVKVIN